jgi:NTE family protein
VGVAWETGLVAGLAAGGVDLRQADLVVGTSAGSMVGTRIAAGQELGASSEARPAARLPALEGGPDMETLSKVFGLWSAADDMTRELRAEIGALALSARTVDEHIWVTQTGGNVGVEDWPETELRLAAVDAQSGSFALFSRERGVPLAHAIAASCAVPGMFPPITMEGRRYMDGGVRSGTSADAALDLAPDACLIIAPICKGTASFGALAERQMNEEAQQLRAAGGRVVCITPDSVERDAFGPNLMDAARAAASADAGYARGLELARGDAGIWNESA